ncbi:hypothetical protein K1719_039124 [Acacia pycnantha]|nr:hypothetical protein K1719_039124 [Acacia pycnantha]
MLIECVSRDVVGFFKSIECCRRELKTQTSQDGFVQVDHASYRYCISNLWTAKSLQDQENLKSDRCF